MIIQLDDKATSILGQVMLHLKQTNHTLTVSAMLESYLKALERRTTTSTSTSTNK